MKDKKLLALLLLGGIGIYYLMNRRPVYAPQFRHLPPPPPRNSPNYQMWVDAIMKVYGAAAALWQPGGPFYNQPGVPAPGTTTPPADPNNPAPGGLY